MSSAALPTFSADRSSKFLALFQNQSPQSQIRAQAYCSLSSDKEAKPGERLKLLQTILEALAFPALDPEQQKLVAIALKLPDRGKSILPKKGIDFDLLMAKMAVDAEIRAISMAPNRWQRLKAFTDNTGKPSRISGPPLLLLRNDPQSTGFMREVFDPKHRAWGQQEGMFPQQEWEREKGGSLFEWADRQQVEGKFSDLGKMEYMSPKDNAFSMLGFANGLILNANKEPYSSRGKWDIFVMDRNANFYIGTHIPSRIHHSCFLGGGPVKCAGELMVTDGVLAGISDRSGHYRPGYEHIITLLRALAFIWGVPLEKVKLEVIKRDEKGQPIPCVSGFEIITLNALETLQNWQKDYVIKRWKEFKKDK